jgi:tetratricopeptide (TPR) repeat protein
VTEGSHRATLRPFTPSRERAEALAERTVGRDAVVDAVCARLRAAAKSKNRPHTLLVGPRGSGKTHVIEVVLHRLLADERCRKRLAIGRVDEDAVGIVSYADVLVELLFSLGVAPDALATARGSRDVAAIEAVVLDQLGGQVLVVVIENLSRLFGALGTSGQRDFRSFVETSGQVVLLASTPLLFRAIASRDEPWFGSFAIEHLSELTLEEGSELLRRLAAEDGDDTFVAFLDSPRGRARLAALHHLAGGSPRLWMILAGCATVELLDELVPAVEELLEKLVTYYQQRLWELPGNEARLVRELGTGPPSASVADIAAACGLEERTAANSLGRLAEAGWVRGEKLPGADQRKTWYRLREPLLRHHFQYRRADGEPLRLIVDILRAWFDPSERRTHLAGARPASQAERHLLASMSLDPPRRSDEGYAARDIDHLLAEARRWIGDPDSIGSPAAGALLETAVIAARTSTEAARAILADRGATPAVGAAAEGVFVLAERQSELAPLEDRVGELLDAASAAVESGPDHRALELVAACWNGPADPHLAVSRLGALIDHKGSDRLALMIRDEHGYWLGTVGRHDESVSNFASVVEDCTHVLGSDHLDTLATRHNLAYQLGELGRHDESAAGLAAVLEACTRVLGSDHPDTLATRHNLAYELSQLARHDEAATTLTAVLDARTRVLGSDHPDTLTTRHNLAVELGELGHHDDSAASLAAVLEDFIRVIGSDHLDTLAIRHNLAYQLSQLGHHDDALDVAAEAIEVSVRTRGRQHVMTEEAVDTLVRIVAGILRAARPLPAPERFGSFAATALFGLFQDMEAAWGGSVEAAVRLPVELRSLVERGPASALVSEPTRH